MRFTFVLPHASWTGGVRVIGIYGEGLARRGHEVFMLSQPTPRPPLRRRAKHLLRTGRWPRPPLSRPDLLERGGVEHRVADVRGPVADTDLPDADVVVATWWETAPWVADLDPRKGAKAYFIQDYGANGGQPLDKVAPTWRLPMHRISISNWLIDLVRSHAGDVPVAYVPNSVEVGQFHAAPRGKQARPTVGFMYSTREQKGCDLAIEAIRRARRRLDSLHVHAFGPDDPDPELPLPDGTDYIVRASEDALRGVYSSCDAWLFTSRLEGFGLPILEAMACRTPVIATPAGAAPDLVTPDAGVLVDDFDPDSIARGIEHIARMSADDWGRLSETAHGRATGYTWEDAVDRFEAALLAAADGRAGSETGEKHAA